MYFKVLT